MTGTATSAPGRDRLLEAARHTFAERGYRGATTREMAERAELSEPMVFRHFGSKAALFEEAAVTPVVTFMDRYVGEWSARPHGTADAVDEVRDFLSRLLDVLAADRQLLLAIMAAGQFDEVLEPAGDRLQRAFARIVLLFEDIIETELTVRRITEPDRPAFARLVLGIVIALGMHSQWLGIDGDGRVSYDRMLDEAARLVVHGIGKEATDGR